MFRLSMHDVGADGFGGQGAEGYLAHNKHPTPWDHHRSLEIGLLQGPAGGGGSYERGTPVGAGSVSYERGTPVLDFRNKYFAES